MIRLVLLFLLLLCRSNVAQALDHPMEFTFVESRELCSSCSMVIAEGNIELDTAERFKDFATAHQLQEDTEVAFNSNGGSLIGALDLGRVIREYRFRTTMLTVEPTSEPARCASACAYAFLGGVVRTKAAGALYGVHQFSSSATTNSGLADAQIVFALLSNYIREMGASTELLEFASVTNADEIHWIDEKSLISLNVITRSGSPLEPTWQLEFGGGGRSAISLRVEGLQSNDKIVRMSASCPLFETSKEFPATLFFEGEAPRYTDIRSMLSREPPILPLADREQMAKLSMATVWAEGSDGYRRELFRKRAAASGYQRSDISILGLPIYTVRLSLTSDDLRSFQELRPSENRIVVGFDQRAFGLHFVDFPSSGAADQVSEFLFECQAQ